MCNGKVREACQNFCSNLVRKKDVTSDMLRKDLKRCLNLSDLTFLSIGSMIGSGLYVLTGTVARDIAGPSIVISYVLAAAASILSAVCYAEFGARVPVTGSAYQFTYICVGEIWGFIVGWNVSLEHAVAVSAIARAWSSYIDAMFGFPIREYMLKVAPMPGGLVATYPDFVAAGLVILMTIIVASGVKLSSKVNIAFATLNMVVIVFIFCTGMYLANSRNWTDVKGGFFPYGWSGTISGASTLIFAYVGYEVVACASEEAVNASRDVPRALFISVAIVVVAYVSASAALTLMVPWFEISINSPFPSAYATRGWFWAKYVVSVGALAAMTAAVLSAMLVVPRYLFAMARDGLIWPIFKKVNEKTGVPVVSTVISGLFCLIMTLIFNLKTLVEFISIGQLMACSFVSLCVIKLRYEPNTISCYETLIEDANEQNSADTELENLEITQTSEGKHNKHMDINLVSGTKTSYQAIDSDVAVTSQETPPTSGTIKPEILTSKYGNLFTWTTNYRPGKVPFTSILIGLFFSTISSIMLLFGIQYVTQWWFLLLLIPCLLTSVICVVFVTAFTTDKSLKTYKVPCVPFLPYISIIINIILILKLEPLTWVRLAIWLAVGLAIYGGYGYRHSVARIQE